MHGQKQLGRKGLTSPYSSQVLFHHPRKSRKEPEGRSFHKCHGGLQGLLSLLSYTIQTHLPSMAWATVNWTLHINQTNQDRHPTLHFKEVKPGLWMTLSPTLGKEEMAKGRK